jgi:hypothetical protein
MASTRSPVVSLTLSTRYTAAKCTMNSSVMSNYLTWSGNDSLNRRHGTNAGEWTMSNGSRTMLLITMMTALGENVAKAEH